jgi:hypothetical protein
MKNKEIMQDMLKIFKPSGVDWMGWEITETNYLTYHHIIEQRNGGEESIYNGALITRKAHLFLNFLSENNPELYREYQYWFRLINDMRRPPSPEIMEIMFSLKARAFTWKINWRHFKAHKKEEIKVISLKNAKSCDNI